MNSAAAAERLIEQVDPATRQEIEVLRADDADLEQLWGIYGERLGLAATGEDPAEAGRKSFKRRLADIRRAVCDSRDVQAVLNDPALSAQVDLALVFAGALLASSFGGVNVALVAVLVAKIGLHKLCRSDEL